MNFKKGEMITVVNWISHNDNSYRGDCLEVLAVDLPFLRVKRHPCNNTWDNITLSLDRVEIKHLSKEFILSVLPDYKEPLPAGTYTATDTRVVHDDEGNYFIQYLVEGQILTVPMGEQK